MNQILITKKLYITPELKRKKKIYKIEFLLSVFLVCILTSFYIYAEYDKGKSEATSQEILTNAQSVAPVDNTIAQSDVLVIVLDDAEQTEEINNKAETPVEVKKEIQQTPSGYNYATIATIKIPKIGVEYAILDGQTDSVEETEALLKMSPTKFWGPEPNEVGNFCIVGHNYRNSKFFSKVPTLVNGDIIEITNLYTGETISYSVYDKYEVVPEDTSCTTQLTDGKKEITLITCTNDNKYRVIVKAVAI